MHLKTILIAGSVLFAGAAIAQTAPNGSSNPGSSMQGQGMTNEQPAGSMDSRGAMQNDMRERNTGMGTGTGMPGGPMATTPGTNSKTGTGAGTTGTGQQGGSGNR